MRVLDSHKHKALLSTLCLYVSGIMVDLGFDFCNQFTPGHIEIDIGHFPSFFLLMLLDERCDFGNICSHHFGYFLTVLEEFKRGHGLDALRRRHILSLVHIHLGKGHVGGFVRHFFEFGSNKLARAACCCCVGGCMIYDKQILIMVSCFSIFYE
jgi:hypothetical protein